MIRCSDGSLYCGISNDLTNRLLAHNSGKGAKYTRSRRPVELIGVSSEMTKGDALRLEYRIKRMPAGVKHHELTKEESTMGTLKGDLRAVAEGIEALIKKVEEIAASIDKMEKPKAARMPAKKKAGAKRPGKATATGTVLAVIGRSRKGVDPTALVKKTGFHKAKVYNIVSVLKRQGKIKAAGRGVYVKA